MLSARPHPGPSVSPSLSLGPHPEGGCSCPSGLVVRNSGSAHRPSAWGSQGSTPFPEQQLQPVHLRGGAGAVQTGWTGAASPANWATCLSPPSGPSWPLALQPTRPSRPSVRPVGAFYSASVPTPLPAPAPRCLPHGPQGPSTQPKVTASGSPKASSPTDACPGPRHASIRAPCPVDARGGRRPASSPMARPSVPLSPGKFTFGFDCVDCAAGTFSGGREGHCEPWAK